MNERHVICTVAVKVKTADLPRRAPRTIIDDQSLLCRCRRFAYPHPYALTCAVVVANP